MGKYNELKRYKQTHGDCSVSQNAKENKQLSAWVRTQKRQYQLMQEGKHSHMSQARADLLDELDFEWVGVKRDQFWKDRYNELVQFNAKNGHIKVPEKYLPAPKLQSWLHAQRRLLKLKMEGKKTALTEDRVKLLAAVGVDEEKKNSTATWMERFNQLKGKIVSSDIMIRIANPVIHSTQSPNCSLSLYTTFIEYKEKHGNCNVPQKYPDNPGLGRWVDNQKSQHKKLYEGKPTHLTIERIQHLVSVGFDFRQHKKGKKMIE
jgi:hypothetical protein